jgi:hypothetical protein
VPVMVTVVPPAMGPPAGLTLVTVGGRTQVIWSAALVALVPPGVVTVMSTVPGASAGDVAVMDVAEFTVKDTAGVTPKSTAVAPVKFVPVMATTIVGPPAGPVDGGTLVTVGGAAQACVAMTAGTNMIQYSFRMESFSGSPVSVRLYDFPCPSTSLRGRPVELGSYTTR